jgi:glutamate/tyrosine decarboxylase-like PLP-dependent enzyme
MTDARSTLNFALGQALSYLEGLERNPVAPTADLATLRRQLNKPLADDGLPPEQVVRELARDVQGGIMGSGSGRFFAWVIGGALPSAVAADWLTAAWDQNAGLYATSPAAAIVEEVCGTWLKEILGLPETASFALVSGCQMAHVTCLAAARHALLEKRGWNVEERGLGGAPQIRILASDQRHGSVDRAVRLLGLGTANVEHLPTDSQGRLAPEAVAVALKKDSSAPAILLLQAGEINIGSFDDFPALIPLAHEHGAWVHVDGAFGLWAAASPVHRHLIQGMAAADSWATDGHKWLNVPFDSGYAIIAHPEAHRASMAYRAPYLTHDSEARDQMDWNPEWSRRARGFATYAALRELGRSGAAAIVEHCCTHAQAIVAGIGRLPGTEILWQPVINQGLVRFLDPQVTDHDRHTDRVIAAINKTGEAFFGGTMWRGQRAMRVSVCNWRTSEDDVRRTVRAVAQAMAAAAEPALNA